MEKPPPNDLIRTLARHDTAIEHLGSQMKTLQGEVHHGFSSINSMLTGLNSKFDRFDAAPRFDFHKTVSTVTKLATLFALVVAGIIWITTGQFAGTMAKQEALNGVVTDKLNRLSERVDWAPIVERKK